jgi:hypothetical protein
MDSATRAIEGEAVEVPGDAMEPCRAGGLLARMRGALLRRVREAAWRVLDLQTEFEALD